MKSYFKNFKYSKYVKLCGEGDIITTEDLESQRQAGIDAYNAASSAFDSAKDLYRNLNRSDFETRTEYKAAKSAAKADLVAARIDRNNAANEFGGDEAAKAARKEKFNSFMNKKATLGQSAAATAAIAGINAVDQATMGDKNFGSQSQAIDGAVHMASGALMKSGNPYCVCEGTLLYTDGGYKPIESIIPSDFVLGYNNKKAELVPVEHIFEPHYKECV